MAEVMAQVAPQTIKLKDCDPNFVNEVISAGGKNAHICFQCGTCTAGCPTVYAMDYTPRQILRMVNLGMRDGFVPPAIPARADVPGESKSRHSWGL